MRLIPLWEADEERAYDLQKSFAPNENGFVNGAYGLSRRFPNLFSCAKEIPRALICRKAMFPIPSMCWRTIRRGTWGLSSCATA